MMIGGIDQQAIVAERFEDRRSLRRRLGREFADRCLGLRKLVVEKLRQRVVERVGAGGARRREKRENPERAEARAGGRSGARMIISGRRRRERAIGDVVHLLPGREQKWPLSRLAGEGLG